MRDCGVHRRRASRGASGSHRAPHGRCDRAARPRRPRRLGRHGGRRRAGAPPALDRRPDARGAPAHARPLGPLRPHLQRRDLQSRRAARRARALGRGAALARPLRHRGAARGHRGVGRARRASARCVGMFAFALWDRRERTLVLARDRLGEKPLYYGWAGSTLRVRLGACRRSPRIPIGRARSTATRSACSCASTTCRPRTRSTRASAKSSPAPISCFEAGAREGTSETYWDAGAVASAGAATPFTGSAEEAVEQTEALIRQSLQGQMMADVPLGAFLSGGIDSSTVVALMQAMSSAPGAHLLHRLQRGGLRRGAARQGGRAPPRHRPHRALRDHERGDGGGAAAALALQRAVRRRRRRSRPSSSPSWHAAT